MYKNVRNIIVRVPILYYILSVLWNLISKRRLEMKRKTYFEFTTTSVYDKDSLAIFCYHNGTLSIWIFGLETFSTRIWDWFHTLDNRTGNIIILHAFVSNRRRTRWLLAGQIHYKLPDRITHNNYYNKRVVVIRTNASARAWREYTHTTGALIILQFDKKRKLVAV